MFFDYRQFTAGSDVGQCSGICETRSVKSTVGRIRSLRGCSNSMFDVFFRDGSIFDVWKLKNPAFRDVYNIKMSFVVGCCPTPRHTVSKALVRSKVPENVVLLASRKIQVLAIRAPGNLIQKAMSCPYARLL